MRMYCRMLGQLVFLVISSNGDWKMIFFKKLRSMQSKALLKSIATMDSLIEVS